MAQEAGSLPTSYTYQRKKPTMQRIFGRDWKIAFVFMAPIVILMVTLVAWPFLKAIYTSMTIYSIKDRTDVFVGLDNYIRLYSDVFYRQAVKATVIFTAGSIFFKLIFGMIAALLLHNQKRWRTIFTGLVLLPWIVPSVVQALTWRSILEPIYGGLNPILTGARHHQYARRLALHAQHRHGLRHRRQRVGRHPLLHRQHSGRSLLHRRRDVRGRGD